MNPMPAWKLQRLMPHHESASGRMRSSSAGERDSPARALSATDGGSAVHARRTNIPTNPVSTNVFNMKSWSVSGLPQTRQGNIAKVSGPAAAGFHFERHIGWITISINRRIQRHINLAPPIHELPDS